MRNLSDNIHCQAAGPAVWDAVLELHLVEGHGLQPDNFLTIVLLFTC